MKDQEKILDHKDYQVFVIGRKDEQDGDVFVQSPETVREDLLSRGLGGSRFLNLQLIENFTSSGDFGGSSSAEQITIFESTAPYHFGQLYKAITHPGETKPWSKEPEREITNSEGSKEMIPVIKMDGVFKKSAIHVEGVDPFYMVFRRNGQYELQTTDVYISQDNWLTTPSVNDKVTVVLLGGDATEGNLMPEIERQKRRMNVEAFNKVEIRELARQSNKDITNIDEFKAWIATIGPGRVKAAYGSEDEAAESASASITEGKDTGQPAAQGKEPQAAQKPTGTEGAGGEGSQDTTAPKVV